MIKTLRNFAKSNNWSNGYLPLSGEKPIFDTVLAIAFSNVILTSLYCRYLGEA